ncbi:MAG: Shedu anti-phage system protein SduA domain-containing protein [Candidatus Vogelbacteria bacterium]
MNFDPNNFREVQYDNSKLYFDKGYSFHEHFKHKQKTKKFPFYRNILKFLEENPNTKIYFTLNEEMKTFQQVSDGFLLNMRAYLDFCRTIASRTGGRLKAFLGQNVDLLKVTATDTEKADFIKANATEKNILDAIKTLPYEAQINITNSLSVASAPKDQSNLEINSTDFISAFSKFLTDKDVQSAFYSNLPKIQIDILKSHISFLKSNLDKNETFIQDWIDEDDGKFRKQRCLIFGLEYVDPKREGQVAGKKFDLLAEHDLEHYVIFELKSPKDDVFKITETETVAGGVSSEYCFSPQLGRAIPEILGYKKMYNNAQGEELQKFGVKVKKPISKCVIVLGTRKDDPVWKENFERIFSCLNGIELLTYNHLIDRLENTVSNLEENTKTL